IFLSVLFAWNALVWLVLGALFSPVFPGGWGGILVAALLVIAPVFILIQGFRGGLYPSGPARLLALRPFWYAQLFLPLLAIAGLVGLVAGWPLGAAREVGQMAVACAGVVLVGMSIWGYIGTRRLVVRHLDLGFDTLPPELDGMRIVQLADLHVGPHTSRRQLERIADAVQDARPDLIALVGDQVDDFARDVEPLGAALRHLTAPLGVIAVPGNHDVYAGWADVRSGMERLGWTVLVNEAIPLEYRGARFWIAGTGDPAGKGGPGGADESVIPDVERTLERVPRDDFTVALAHN